jgi:alpha-tubulin suppressor-like RCC1 family protein
VAPAGAVELEPFQSGDNYRCFIDEPGAVWCFGNNLSGRLGSIEAATAVEPILVPTGSTTFQQVGVGASFACALPDDGGLPFCWGASTNGMSGTGSTAAILPPTQIIACR